MASTTVRVATAADKELYKNLFNIYHNELGIYCSEFQDVDNNGYFDNHYVEQYFSGNNALMPMVIEYDERIVGFAVVSIPPFCAPGCDFCLQELFVVGYYRGSGVATAAVNEIFNLFHGRFCAASLSNNERALTFLRNAFAPFGGEEKPFGEAFVMFEATV
jgi:predicted acetyltransferase